MKILRRATDNGRLRAPEPSGARRSILRGVLRGLVLGAFFPLAALSLDFILFSLPISLASIAQLHAINPLHWIVDLAPFVFAIAGGCIGQSRASLDWHRKNLEASVREQTTALVSFAGDLKHKNAALRRATRAAEFSSARFEQMFRGLPIAAFTLDSEGRVAFWNAEAEHLFCLTAADVVGRKPQDVLPMEGDPALVTNAVGQVLGGFERRSKEDVVVQPDGRRVSVLCSTFPLFSTDGQLLGAVSTATDTSKLKAMEEELERQLERNQRSSEELVRINRLLQEQATTDGLTGLKNHRAFQERLAEEVRHAGARGNPLSLAMIDADEFKVYNDSFGHPQGDAVLHALATLLKQGTRPRDFAARYGGEEFALLLPNTPASEAIEVAERLRTLVEQAGWEHRPVTVSIGVATLGDADTTPAELVEAADRALYQAKSQGRNRCVHITDLQATPNAAIRIG